VAANTSIIFDMPPDKRLGSAMGLLGIDLASLSEEAGHA
jgi:putative transcriptional regulator